MKTVRIALAGATLWGIALVVAALTVPVYHGEFETTESGSTTVTSTSATLVSENGWWGLVVAGIPLVVCLVVGALLLGPGGPAAKVVAVVVVALLGLGNLLAMLSIGIFVLPVTVALVVAVATADRRPGHSTGPTRAGAPAAP